ncbi:hypothetical protein O6H91_06G031600 [Diphasiastrum complanatum]|uniref:Uncharacterized protein n=4 Tax=Diphasiastrum complanatum TaxID=34168 RepID=A0ACC2DCC5_DIPCM|nr:hypothetical protein O6H91_06G029800 [Diphasiastrum complanatum]KAJ7551813.1 hypothetical protein O6H91_06G029800 [Diphasiastrum complanatum]KAJ7551814.1 hypothetical protein O6H91_06G029900 [Diphasiastrum complanatum]KAJ7551845.1 hypothetical protein O6H91_06G031600 [Diphasiastrum complanatum]
MASEGNCLGWAARDSSGTLSPYKFSRREPGADDVSFKITHCGICYAEVVWLFNKLGDAKYPMVPGHEIVGIVTAVGSNVSNFQKGERVGVGCIVGSCRDCEFCDDGKENYCAKRTVATYNGVDVDGTITKGGYSSYVVVHQRYVVKIPEKLPLHFAAPLLCAGITVYSPMKRHGMDTPGKHLGVIGLGGLGHMAVKFGKAFGLKVSVLSTSPGKREEALTVLGADNFIVTSNEAELKAAEKSMDYIIDTASGEHPLDNFITLLKTSGVIVLVGVPHVCSFAPINLILGMKTISGSMIGGIKETQDMINFCAEHEVHPLIEIVPISYANKAIERLRNKDVRYRFVIDIADSLHDV